MAADVSCNSFSEYITSNSLYWRFVHSFLFFLFHNVGSEVHLFVVSCVEMEMLWGNCTCYPSYTMHSSFLAEQER